MTVVFEPLEQPASPSEPARNAAARAAEACGVLMSIVAAYVRSGGFPCAALCQVWVLAALLADRRGWSVPRNDHAVVGMDEQLAPDRRDDVGQRRPAEIPAPHRAAEERVAREQHRGPGVLERERRRAGRVAGRVDAAQSDAARRQHVGVGEVALERADL